MTPATLVLRSLRFHARQHLGVLLGATLATAILVGALAVGDSVRHSLARQALLRLGQTHFVVHTHDRFFRDRLADELSALLHAPVAPAITTSALFSTPDGSKRVNNLQLLGADPRFHAIAHSPDLPPPPTDPLPPATAWANPEFRSRARLDAPSTPAIVRLEKPSWLPRDAPLASDTDSAAALRLTLASTDAPHRFSLQATQASPPTLTVSLPWLQKELSQPSRANLLLIGQNSAGTLTADQVNAALRQAWTLADADLALSPAPSALELRTDRVFLEPPVVAAATQASPPARHILTYFVNELRIADRSAPYSFVSALDPATPLPGDPTPLRDDEIILNTWLAADLQAQPGDTLTLKYHVVSTGRTLDERATSFRVRAILPIDPADASLSPRIPGLSDKENCRDWDPGTSVRLDRIRPLDEDYWAKHRSTPKAFVTLAAGEKMWSNRFGDRTALRWPADTDPAALSQKIRASLDPARLGLFARPLRDEALRAARESQDFGGLFLGLSFFLVAAALILLGLLFAFGLQRREREIGTLLAVGWTPAAVRRLFLLEGLALALVGGLVGTLAGLAYAQLVLAALARQWRDAIAGAQLWFHATPATLAIGAASGALVASGVIWLVLRRTARRPARALLAGVPPTSPSGPAAPRPTRPLLLASVSTLLATGLLVRALLGQHSPADFFAAGALLLVAALAASSALLATAARRAGPAFLSTAGLALQNATRRPARSLATIGLLACGAFLVIAVGANRHDPTATASLPSSGTGGFALFAETALPLHQDLNSPSGRENLSLPAAALDDTHVLPFRLREGDDASCLNLNRAQTPRLLGLTPPALATRAAFTFLSPSHDSASPNPWLLLDSPQPDGAIPAIGDEATTRWALGKKVGDTIPYTDARGRTFSLRLVGVIANSVFQGSLLISEKNFVTLFPADSGHRVFLIDAPAARSATVADTLSRALRDHGFEAQSAAQRLALFQRVENTYLAIFQALGGLGLLLGGAGLGIVVLRNALERRGELALLRAVGFTRRRLRHLLALEHAGLLVLGLASGVIAALVAVLPALLASASQVPWPSLALTLCALLVNGSLWIWLAGSASLRGDLLRPLRDE